MSNTEKTLWPGWETVRVIGHGSFGTVYEIQRRIFDDVEKAALKVISIPQNASDVEELYSDGYDEESITATFRAHLKSIVAEYSLMRKMNGSANVVNCDDVRYVQHDDGIGWDIFIKMELLTPLTKVLPEKVEESRVLQIAKDLCAALVLCNKHEIIHRDIKPQNIFVSPNGDYKLGDFGVAKTVEKTMGGTKIGTYKYMAPEVYNNQPYGSSADIYSLGLVLYWLLNDRRMPFLPLPPARLKTGMEEEARRRRLMGETLPAPAHGSVELKRIVLKACAYDQKKRYSSATQMLEDLNALTKKTPTVVTPFKPARETPVVAPLVEPAATAGFCIACGTPLEKGKNSCRMCGRPVNATMKTEQPEDLTATVGPVFVTKTGPKQQNNRPDAPKSATLKKEQKQGGGKITKKVVLTVALAIVYLLLILLMRSCVEMGISTF